MPLDIAYFVSKWNASQRAERAGFADHFRDLCEVLGVPHPTQEDEVGSSYTYEKRVTKTGGGVGYADVWKRGFFAWEYKSKGGDLNAAYKQLSEYHEDLENPPILVVCDFVRFEVHTKFENVVSRVYKFSLDDLLHDRDTPTCALPPLEVLRHVFGDFNQLRPNVTAARVTEAAAKDFLRLAQQLELERAIEPQPSKQQIAHFLMRLVFCLFADSVELLPNHAFRRLVHSGRGSLRAFNKKLPVLFEAMSVEGGFFGADDIKHFNGGLFKDNSTIELNHADIAILISAANHDWSHIEPAIFGTLFERSLDAAKRSLIGAHYTSTDDILLLIEPVVMQPLLRRWQSTQTAILAALAEEEPPSGLSSQSAPSNSPSHATLNSPSHVTSNLSSRSAAERSASGAATTPGAPSSPTASSSAKVGPATALNPDLATALNPGLATALNPGPATAPSAEGAAPYQPGAKPQEPAAEQSRGLKARLINTPKASKPVADPRLILNRPALILLQDFARELSTVRVLDPACGSGNFLYVALKRLLDLWHDARNFGFAHGLSLSLDPMPSPAQLFGIEIDFYAHEIASIVVWIGFLQWKRDHGIDDDKQPLLQKLTNIELGDAIMRYDADHKPYEPTWPQADYIVGNPPFLGGTDLRLSVGDIYAEDLVDLYKGRLPARVNLVTYWFEKARANIEVDQAQRAGLLATQAIRQGVSRVSLDRIKKSGDIFYAWSDRPWVLDGAAVRISMVAFDSGMDTQCLLNGLPAKSINSRLRDSETDDRAAPLQENKSIAFQGVILVGSFEVDEKVARKLLDAPVNPNARPNSDVVKMLVSADDITGKNHHKYLIDFTNCATENDAALYELPFEYISAKVKRHRAASRSGDRTGVLWWKLQRSRPKMRQAIGSSLRYIATPRVSKHRLFAWVDARLIPDTRLFVFARDDDFFFGVLHSQVHELWSLWNAAIHGDGDAGGRPTYTTEVCFQNFPFPWPPGKEPTDDPRVETIAAAARELVRLRDNWLNPKKHKQDDPEKWEAELKKRTLTNLYNQRPTWLSNAHRALDEAVFAAYGWPSTLTAPEVLSHLLALNHARAAAALAKPQKPV